MDCTDEPPQSVFNTNCSKMISFLKDELKKHRKPETECKPLSELHLHQIEAALKVHEYFSAQGQVDAASPSVNIAEANRRIALVVLPTGCGKTGVAVLASYVLDASRVLVITPSVIISKQVRKAYREFLLDKGVIKPENIKKARVNMLPDCPLITKSTEIPDALSAPVMVVNAHKIGGRASVKIKDIPFNAYDLVIVDEAHHYPAPTWKEIVDHFYRSRRLFLTATPEHRGKPILPQTPCYELKKEEAVKRGIIRDVLYDELTGGDEEYQRFQSIVICMELYLNEHDRLEPDVRHQGMVIAQTVRTINPAELFCKEYNRLHPGRCAIFVKDTPDAVLNDFVSGKIRTLVIIGRLLEGFDHNKVSVVGIMRNIAPTSRVLFAQFVGRAVRKTGPNDRVNAQIVTHEKFDQLYNYNSFDKLAEDDPNDDDLVMILGE